MAVYDGGIEYAAQDICVLYWLDPKRYRATIWQGSRRLKTMVDKDRMRLRNRVSKWLVKNTQSKTI
jgi:hypothetical protein